MLVYLFYPSFDLKSNIFFQQPLSTYEYSVDARGIAKSEVLIPELNFSMSHNDPDPEGMTFQLGMYFSGFDFYVLMAFQ